MSATPVIAIIDVGKTNKKLFLFDQNYKIVFERSARFIETTDEDGFPCENLESLRLSVFDSLRDVFRQRQFDIKALNFSTYGASFVYIDKDGKTLAPLYNYLKPYPEELSQQFYEVYGGEEKFALQTSSPILGSLNSGLQIYRLKQEQPKVFKQLQYALHLPQYLSYLITNNPCTDITSIGCHTALWDYKKNKYHRWVTKEGIAKKLAPIAAAHEVQPAAFPGDKYQVGVGLHDSSASLIPYLVNFHEPFILISTGTWCISLNPFNEKPLTADELKQDCLSYLTYQGKPVKASRLFAGQAHETATKAIATAFNINPAVFKAIKYSAATVRKLNKQAGVNFTEDEAIIANFNSTTFLSRDWSTFATYEEAYHRLIMDLVARQLLATRLVLEGSAVRRLFVDGGFSKNPIFMNLLAVVFPDVEVYAASMAQATAIGAALAIHDSWNPNPVPADIIELKYYGYTPQMAVQE